MMQFILLILSIILLIVGHALFWYALVSLFQITSFYYQLFFAFLIFILFLGAIISSFLIHRWNNTFFLAFGLVY